MQRKPRFYIFAGILLAAIVAAGLFFGLRRPQPPAQAEVVPPAEEVTTNQVTLYFANRAYVETGNEALPRLISERRVFSQAGPVNPETVLRALQEGPRDSGTQEASPVIRPDLRILGVKIQNKVAFVDFSPENLSGGSLEEMLMIQGVVETLTAMPEIEAVQFLINGKTAETLMGHFSVGEPLTAGDL